MALAAASGLASFDQSSGEMLDLSDVLAAVVLADTFLLGHIGIKGQATETRHYWMEDALNATTVTQLSTDTTLDTTDTSIVLASGHGARLRVGALLVDTAAGTAGEIIQVTNISTDTLTVVRGYGSTTAVAHGDPSVAASCPVFRIVSQPVQENDTGVTDRSKVRTQKYNVTQIFKAEAEISGTMLAVKQAGVPDELSYQLQQRTLELNRELGINLWHGVRSSSAGSDTAYRSFGGLRWFLNQSSASIIDLAGTLDAGAINAMYRNSYDQGGDCDTFVGEATQIARVANIDSDKIRLAPSERVRGVFVQKFLTDVGVELDLLADRWIAKDEAAVFSKKRCAVMPLAGRQWQMQPLAKAGDGARSMIVGEYTFEYKNATETGTLRKQLAI